MSKTFKVVTKAAVFNHNKSKILVIHMNKNNDYGLPGGHIEEDETIDAAMARELYEECGIKDIKLNKVDFFTHSNGKIVLAYLGVLDHGEQIGSTQGNLEGIPKWLAKEEFTNINIEANYKKLVLENWK